MRVDVAIVGGGPGGLSCAYQLRRMGHSPVIFEAMAKLGGGVKQVYFGGELEAGVALTGQVAGRIDAVKPVADIIAETVREYATVVEGLARQLPGS